MNGNISYLIKNESVATDSNSCHSDFSSTFLICFCFTHEKKKYITDFDAFWPVKIWPRINTLFLNMSHLSYGIAWTTYQKYQKSSKQIHIAWSQLTYSLNTPKKKNVYPKIRTLNYNRWSRGWIVSLFFFLFHFVSIRSIFRKWTKEVINKTHLTSWTNANVYECFTCIMLWFTLFHFLFCLVFCFVRFFFLFFFVRACKEQCVQNTSAWSLVWLKICDASNDLIVFVSWRWSWSIQ